MNDPTWPPHEEAVYRVLARNGVPDPGAALCALLWLLRDRHRQDLTAFVTQAYREDFELPDPGAGTVAEALRDRAASTADGYETESPAPAMQVVADLLAELIPLWDAEALDDAAGGAFGLPGPDHEE